MLWVLLKVQVSLLQQTGSFNQRPGIDASLQRAPHMREVTFA
jgi:hypothetical protein